MVEQKVKTYKGETMHIFDDLEIINFNHYQGLTLEGEPPGRGQLILKDLNGKPRIIAQFEQFHKAEDAFYDFCDALIDSKSTWDVHDFQVHRSLIVDTRPDEVWTVDSFGALVSEEGLREVYESNNDLEEVYEYGMELMNFIQEQGWDLTIQFLVKHIFLFSGNRRLFGINLFTKRAKFTFCHITEKDVKAIVPDHEFIFFPQYSQAACRPGPTAQDLRPLFEFVYNQGQDLTS